MYLWVAPVEAICSGMPEPFGDNMAKSTTVCLDYFKEIVPCIGTCPSGQHLACHEPVLTRCYVFLLDTGTALSHVRHERR